MARKNYAARRREDLNKRAEAHKKRMQPSGNSEYARKQRRREEEARVAKREENRLQQTSSLGHESGRGVGIWVGGY